jgi:hypothetical protein
MDHQQAIFNSFYQCCGSMTFWGGSGSGSADPCLWLMNPDFDPDPGPGSGSWYFRRWPPRCQQKNFFNTIFSAYYFLKLHLHHFWKIKCQKVSQNSRNQGFSYYFCMMIKGSGSGFGSGLHDYMNGHLLMFINWRCKSPDNFQHFVPQSKAMFCKWVSPFVDESYPP